MAIDPMHATLHLHFDDCVLHVGAGFVGLHAARRDEGTKAVLDVPEESDHFSMKKPEGGPAKRKLRLEPKNFCHQRGPQCFTTSTSLVTTLTPSLTAHA